MYTSYTMCAKLVPKLNVELKKPVKVRYLDWTDIDEYNKFAITLFEVKKADQYKLMSLAKLQKIVKKHGDVSSDDIYESAMLLVKWLCRYHPFSSGNRRTALLAAIFFLLLNGEYAGFENDESNSDVLTGIREGYYTDDEIKVWVRTGEIRKFERPQVVKRLKSKS